MYLKIKKTKKGKEETFEMEFSTNNSKANSSKKNVAPMNRLALFLLDIGTIWGIVKHLIFA